MDIIKRFESIKESYYLDSLKETDLTEQADEDVPEEVPEEAQEEAPRGMEPGADPSQFAQYGGEQPEEEDPNPMDGGQVVDPATGLPQEIKSPTYLGRIYQLNKIYYRMRSLQKFLANASDEELSGIRQIHEDSFEIFNLVMNNLASYKNMIDKIILQFYTYISNLSILLNKYYSRAMVEKKAGQKS